jgi:hypothetical protein
MEEFLDSFTATPSRAVDFQKDLWPMLTSPTMTSHAAAVVEADADRVFPRRYDLAEYLHGLIPGLGMPDPTRNPGLWAWLALLWFEQLAPPDAEGIRSPGERARWIPQMGWKYYRHLVLGPYLIYATCRDDPRRALALLHNPPHTPGELVGQLAATQDVAQCRAAISVATALYYDAERQTLRRGAGGSGPGSARRYRTILDQLDRTYDLHSISEEGLLALLPEEFDRFSPGRRKRK